MKTKYFFKYRYRYCQDIHDIESNFSSYSYDQKISVFRPNRGGWIEGTIDQIFKDFVTVRLRYGDVIFVINSKRIKKIN